MRRKQITTKVQKTTKYYWWVTFPPPKAVKNAFWESKNQEKIKNYLDNKRSEQWPHQVDDGDERDNDHINCISSIQALNNNGQWENLQQKKGGISSRNPPSNKTIKKGDSTTQKRTTKTTSFSSTPVQLKTHKKYLIYNKNAYRKPWVINGWLLHTIHVGEHGGLLILKDVGKHCGSRLLDQQQQRHGHAGGRLDGDGAAGAALPLLQLAVEYRHHIRVKKLHLGDKTK